MIYLDHAATTPPLEPALREAWPWMTSRFGNPSSQHAAGRDARRALAEARNRIADVLGTGPQGVIFTSGGTESVNLALRGLARKQPRARQIISAPIEHSCVLQTLEDLHEKDGFDLEWLTVDHNGCVDPEELESRIDSDTTLVTLSSANNETGAIQPMAAIRRICASHDVPLHDDTIQSAGWLPTSMDGVAHMLMSFSGHKLGAPKGIGVLALSRGMELVPQQTGGGQENGMRAGTQNVAFAVAMAHALEYVVTRRRDGLKSLSERIARFEYELQSAIPGLQVLVDDGYHLPSIRTLLFEGLQGGVLLQELDRLGICASAGSACSSASDEASHVLRAMGLEEEISRSAVRFSFSTTTSAEELERAAELTINAVRSFRSLRRV